MDYPPYPDFDAWVITHRYSIAHKDGDAPYTLLHGYIKHTYCPISLHIRSNTTHFFVRGHHREPNAPDIHPYNLNNVHDHDLAVFFDFSPPDSNNIHATTITQLEQLTDPIDITRTLRALLRALYPRRTYDRINIVLSLLRSTIPPNCAQHPIEYHCFFLRDAKTKNARWANMDMIAEWIGQPAIIFGAFGEQRWSTNTAWHHIIQYIVQQYNTTVHTTTSVHHHVAQLRNAEQHRIPNLPTSIQHS